MIHLFSLFQEKDVVKRKKFYGIPGFCLTQSLYIFMPVNPGESSQMHFQSLANPCKLAFKPDNLPILTSQLDSALWASLIRCATWLSHWGISWQFHFEISCKKFSSKKKCSSFFSDFVLAFVPDFVSIWEWPKKFLRQFIVCHH